MSEDKEIKEYTKLRFLVESYYDAQKLRIMTDNRLLALSRFLGVPLEDQRIVGLTSTSTIISGLEKSIVKMLRQELADYTIYTEWMHYVKGLGPVLSAGLIAWIQDISKFDNVSKLWAFSGYHVIEGKAPRRTRGAKINWNPHLKTHCWKVGKQFVKTKCLYREYYLKFKAAEAEKHPDLTKGHIDARARRKVVKLFLSHLWAKWRELEGLPVTKPYSIGMMKHAGYIEPEEPTHK